MKASIKRMARHFGLELNRYHVATSSAARLQRILSAQKIDLVLDVGANVGQFAREIRSGGYRKKIVSFEPVSTSYQELLRNSKGDSQWIVASQVAIGDEDGEVKINISSNSFSNSILNVLESHVKCDASAGFISHERVRITTLDTIAGEHLATSTSAFLKIDTQGYESQVLAGAARSLKIIKCVQMELSLVPLYEGQALFAEMIERMRELGFALYGVIPGFADEETGRLMQADGIFLRET